MKSKESVVNSKEDSVMKSKESVLKSKLSAIKKKEESVRKSSGDNYEELVLEGQVVSHE